MTMNQRTRPGWTGPLILVQLFLIIGLILWQVFTPQPSKIGYVEVGELYEEFSLTKELDARFQNTNRARQQVLDSLGNMIQRLERDSSGSTRLRTLQYAFQEKQQAFEEDSRNQLGQYNEQISGQLNQYIEEFRQEEGYDILLGAQGSGAIMAVDSALNVTQTAITYINQRYAGL